MKKLEELGISPTPWSIGYNCGDPQICVDGGRGVILDKTWDCEGGCYVGFDESELRLIAAAPDMYEALLGLLEIVCDDCKCSYETEGKCVKCPRVVAAEKALAKAAGEEVVK